MSEDRESLADQAAAWVPPWARSRPDAASAADDAGADGSPDAADDAPAPADEPAH